MHHQHGMVVLFGAYQIDGDTLRFGFGNGIRRPQSFSQCDVYFELVRQ
jgi:hypothetical protein